MDMWLENIQEMWFTLQLIKKRSRRISNDIQKCALERLFVFLLSPQLLINIPSQFTGVWSFFNLLPHAPSVYGSPNIANSSSRRRRLIISMVTHDGWRSYSFCISVDTTSPNPLCPPRCFVSVKEISNTAHLHDVKHFSYFIYNQFEFIPNSIPSPVIIHNNESTNILGTSSRYVHQSSFLNKKKNRKWDKKSHTDHNKRKI